MAAANDSDRLAVNYAQWKTNKLILKKLQERTTGFQLDNHRNQKFRLIQAFSRWLLVLQHCDVEQPDDRFPLFPRQSLKDTACRNELSRLLEECFTNLTLNQAKKLVDELLHDCESLLSSNSDSSAEEPPEIFYEENMDRGKISVGDYSTPNSPRIKYLVQKFGRTSTALVCLRYDSLSNFKGGESGLSAAVFDVLCDIGQVRYEGFSSPLNSGLMGRPDTRFCSLFEDTDSVFGSLGNFFRIDIAEHPGGWILSPPFVESIMESMAKKVVQLLDSVEPGSFWFFIVCPWWEDCEAWKILDRSEWKVEKLEFQRGQLGFDDCYGTTQFRLNIKICMFVMGEVPDDVDLSELQNRMRFYHALKQRSALHLIYK